MDTKGIRKLLELNKEKKAEIDRKKKEVLLKSIRKK
ncbi:hypothetical protein DFO70_11778 [Cytobacillus firmus]|uniref:Uncharacterized protein n=2 Tax=Cytobacillus TaxID=2675230 RepID=A0A366JM55_CYTFI|nr:hypothetical protein DFO70_11778 [Cytobacillus firmus]TDX39250.1 hypothetical protein DFO72_11180 [Cytobacillus oceanisediminis]